MKPIRPLLSTLAAAATLLAVGSTAFAQTPGPVPSAPPPPPLDAAIPPRPSRPPVPPVPPVPPLPPRRAGSFLGVVATPAPRALTEQMGLPAGFGLVVNSVVPDSPAAAAGVQPYDILQMLNDQRLVSPEQLGALVRSFPDGTSVTLTLLRKGQEQKVTAKVVRRAGDDRRPGRNDRHDWPHFSPEDLFGGGGDSGGRGPGRRRFVFRQNDGEGRARGTAMNLQDARIVMKDSSGEVEVVHKDGKRQVTVKKPDGAVIYSGPADSEEDRNKLPEDARKKLDRILGMHRDGNAQGSSRHGGGSDSGDSADSDDDEFIFEDSFTRPMSPPTPPTGPSSAAATLPPGGGTPPALRSVRAE